MPTLTIPGEHASGLLKIMELSPDDSDRVTSALRKAQSIKLGELTALCIGRPAITGRDRRERNCRDASFSLRSTYEHGYDGGRIR